MWLYTLLLYLFPPSFRRQFADELLQVARTAVARGDITRGGLVSDLCRSALREWLDTRHHTVCRSPGRVMRDLIRDARHAVRLLIKAPGFTLAAVMTLALAIGANSAMFSLMQATLLRPIAASHPNRLASWTWTSAYPDYIEFTKRTDIFQGVMAWSGASRVSVALNGPSELATALFVSGNSFAVLGVPAAIGRTIVPADDVRNGPIVGMLNYQYWRARFGGDVAVIGQRIRVNDQPVTIVGVGHESFRGMSLGSTPSIYLPVSASGQIRGGFFARPQIFETTNFVWLNVVGRLRDDISLDQASAAVETRYLQLHPPKQRAEVERLALSPLNTRALGGNDASTIRDFVLLLLGVVALTLLIGCANLANLLLARSASRRQEVGVRLAVGATRGQVARQLLVESVLLAMIGGVAGLAVASAALHVLAAYQLPGGIPIHALGLSLDNRTLIATTGLSLITGALFGVAPAWNASRTDVMVTMRGDTRSTISSTRLRSALVAAQMAVSLVLLVGSGLFLRSLVHAVSIPTGFNVEGVAAASVNAGLARYDAPRARAFYDQVLERVRALPHVKSAAWTTIIPSNGLMMNQVDIEGYSVVGGEPPTFYVSQVGPEYFASVGTRLLSGRGFTRGDRDGSALVAVVSRAAAERFWPGRNVVGELIKPGGSDPWRTIVGVVEDVIVRQLGEERVPYVFYPFDQQLGGMGSVTDPAHLMVRVDGDPRDVLSLLAAQIRSVDPHMPVYDVVPFAEHVRELVMPQQMGATLLAFFSVLALSLASVGIYGVASHVAQLRTRELGIRIALGASAQDVRRLVMAHGVVPAVAGIAMGIGLALWAARAARTFLYDVSPNDPTTFASVSALLLLIAWLATWLPARRVARLDAVAALRVQ